ncbi:hypothetical protein ACWDYH_02700 [Nocardia goodfellowii]
MNEPDRILHLVHTAVTALVTGGQPALDVLIRDLDDRDLETLIAHMARGIGAHARPITTTPRNPEAGQR